MWLGAGSSVRVVGGRAASLLLRGGGVTSRRARARTLTSQAFAMQASAGNSEPPVKMQKLEAVALDEAEAAVESHAMRLERLQKVLLDRGFTMEEVNLAVQRNPQLVTYSIEKEITPRLNFLEYLHERGEFIPGEGVPQYVARQPFCLEMKLMELYSDDRYSCVRKPFYVRHDTPRGWDNHNGPRYTVKYDGDTSAEEFLMQTYPDLKPRFCHQIDFATEGCLLAAKSKQDAAAASKGFSQRTNKKTYLALVFGHPEQDTWVVDAPITVDETDDKGFKMRIARADEPAGKPSQTEVQVLTRGFYTLEGAFKGKPISKVLLRPLTGRRHQIRVHLQLSGFPIVGDSAYAADKDSHRMFLLAHELMVPLPQRPLHITLPEPFAWKMALSTDQL